MMITKFGNFTLLKIRKDIITSFGHNWERTLLVDPIDNLRESFSDVVWMGINLNQRVLQLRQVFGLVQLSDLQSARDTMKRL